MSIEQLANLQIRWGTELMREETKTDPAEMAPVELIREGRRQLELLLQLGVTVERLSLKGSACKWLAMVSAGEERDAALKEMIECYRQAHELVHAQSGAVDPYPLLNWLVGLQLADLRHKTRKTKNAMGAWLGEVEKVADERDEAEPCFWNGIVRTECLLVRHLAAGDLVEHGREIVDGYLRVCRRGATPKERRSVLEHFEFIIAMLDGETHASLRHAMETICHQLSAALK
jgi:hypothetical protein